MRRILALLLVTPILANCSEPTAAPATTPMAHPGAMHADMDMPETWPAEQNWWTPGDAFTGDLDQFQPVTTLAAPGSPLQGAPDEGEVVSFGHADVGTQEGSHDQSFNARDKIIPGTVVINAGQTVTFNVVFGHRVAIYDDGTKPNDIQHVPGEGDFVLDPNHRLFLQPFPTPQFKLRFIRPGKYLMLCAINKHFFLRNQWGYIIVR